ncbi:putative acylesterase/phospholipase RssA/CRP-like cAMP-binding protein [Paenibacillus castaneae]|uniref:patatin-like phospholipase family protein n=1 Tax=Paenibacillus castaneae TaxID=474957 RepID=UPI000C9AB85B|nr:patatin-like phospholipase family protein [Paenibacillus castaneae]NIK79142.1 putative acylesterase/phospholipase RssA/CRP-like cAMP-binding protein [Paenibacillus castaneae]
MKIKTQVYPIIDGLKESERTLLLPYLKEYEFTAGTVILRQGEVRETFHILLSGTVSVYLENELRVRIATLRRGDFIGEMSCFTGDTVSATVEAVDDVSTVSMSREGIQLMMDGSPAFRNHMIEAMVKRIQNSNERVMEEHVKSHVIINQLEQEGKQRYGKLIGGSKKMMELRYEIERLSEHVEPLCIVGENGVGKAHAAAAIHYHSRMESLPLLNIDSADFNLNMWDMKVRAAAGGTIVLRQAERLPAHIINEILQSSRETRVILTAESLPMMNAQQLHIAPLRERSEDTAELVHYFLEQAGAESPQDVISQEALRMLSLFPFLTGNVAELMRVVREAYIISNGRIIRNNHIRFGRHRAPGSRPTIGLALGSGSIRGAAHVGVLKALEKEGIPIDMIAGTSVGAFIGALYASGQPISEFERVLPTLRWRQLFRLNLSQIAIANNNPMERFMENYIGQKYFEDLNIPFAAVASDANTGEAHILRTGLVSQAIRATTAVPGLIKPVNIGGRTLVNGTVVHPVPVALVKSMGADIAIAVDVSAPTFTKTPGKNFVCSILKTMDMMSERMIQEELQVADVIISPQLGISRYHFKDSSIFIEEGERVAREAMAEIKDKIHPSTYRSYRRSYSPIL